MFISIHIPKTAGTTIGYILDYGTRRKVFYDYEEIHNPEMLEKEISYLQENKDFIENRFELIHGHFKYRKYANIFPNAKYLVCLREPVSRMISQYYHIIQEANPNHWLYERIMTGQLSITQFASMKHLVNVQEDYCRGKDLEDYDFIFISENLPQSIYKFQKKFGFQRNDPYMVFSGKESIPNTNPKTARKTKIPKKLIVTDEQRKQLKDILREEREFYNRAVIINKKY